jgi:CRP-like cAMP-binding protein
MGNHFLLGLTPEQFGVLAPLFRNVVLTPGATLWRRGQVVQRVILPHSGLVSLGIQSEQGRVVDSAFVGREGVLGSLAACGVAHAIGTATVRVEGTATEIEAEPLQQALSGMQPLREQLMHYEADITAQVLQTAACNATHPVRGRLARALLQIQDRTKNSVIPATQLFLATMLGVRRTTVTLEAAALQECGALRWQRNRVTVLRRDLLEENSCCCYSQGKEHERTLLNGYQLAMNDLRPPPAPLPSKTMAAPLA